MKIFSTLILTIILSVILASSFSTSQIHHSDTFSLDALRSSGVAWPMFQGNPQHSGFARRIVSEGNPQLVWEWKKYGESFLSPVIGYDGMIYVVSKHRIYALNPAGKLEWSYYISENISSPPAVDKKGNIYLGCMSYTASKWGGHIYSLDRNGNLRWSYDAKGWVQSEPVIDSLGIIYFYSSSEYLYAFYPDGSLKWKVKIPESFSIPDAKNTPAIGLNGTVYFPATNRIVVISSDGEILKNITLQDSPTSQVLDYVAVMDWETIYIGIRACGMGFYAVGVNGEMKWHYGRAIIKSVPGIASDGTIYVVTAKNTLLALNSDGEVKWSFGGKKYLIFSQAPTISGNGFIYITGKEIEYERERYYVYAISPEGKVIWKYEIDGAGNTVLGNNGFLYVSTSNRTIYAFKIGKCVKSVPSPPGVETRVENKKIVLEIHPSFDDGGMSIQVYRIYRSVNGGKFVKVAEIKNLTYEEHWNGGKVRYYVTAVNSMGESEKSNIVEISLENEYIGDKNLVYYVIFGVSSILIVSISYYSLRRRGKQSG